MAIIQPWTLINVQCNFGFIYYFFADKQSIILKGMHCIWEFEYLVGMEFQRSLVPGDLQTVWKNISCDASLRQTGLVILAFSGMKFFLALIFLNIMHVVFRHFFYKKSGLTKSTCFFAHARWNSDLAGGFSGELVRVKVNLSLLRYPK